MNITEILPLLEGFGITPTTIIDKAEPAIKEAISGYEAHHKSKVFFAFGTDANGAIFINSYKLDAEGNSSLLEVIDFTKFISNLLAPAA